MNLEFGEDTQEREIQSENKYIYIYTSENSGRLDIVEDIFDTT